MRHEKVEKEFSRMGVENEPVRRDISNVPAVMTIMQGLLYLISSIFLVLLAIRIKRHFVQQSTELQTLNSVDDDEQVALINNEESFCTESSFDQ